MRPGNLCLGAYNLDGCERSDFHLFAVVVIQLLSERQRLAAHLHVLVEAHEIRVQIYHRCYGCDHLLLEDEIRNLDIVLRDPDETRVQRNAESTKQLLGELDVDVTRVHRVDFSATAV